MKSLAFISFLLLPGCFGGERAETGQCPAGETCSPLTPRGLEFVGADLTDELDLSGPSPTAIGGTQDVQLKYDPTEGHFIPLDLAFTADDDGGNGVEVDHTAGSVVTLRGVGSRTNYLRIEDASTGELFDRKQVTGAAIDSVKLVVDSLEVVPANLDVAFLAGDVQVGVALLGAVQESSGPTEERLVDQSMVLSLAGATQRAWDRIEVPSATAGTYSLAVTAGNRPTANLDLYVVDHIDSLVSDAANPATVTPNGAATICFDGLANGRYVAGLAWHFLVNNVDTAGLGNCVGAPANATGTVAIVGSADGLSATATVTVGTARTLVPPRTSRPRPSTAGDRAAM